MERVNKAPRLNDDEGSKENEKDEEVKVDNDNELSDMDKLPPEILMKILCYLDEQQLVKCRLLNSRWNEICCLLLQDKSNKNPQSKLVLELEKTPREFSLDCKTVIRKSLEDFLNCFFPFDVEKSSPLPPPRPFPFSNFKISGLNYMYMDQLTKFVLTFRHIKTLFLEIKAGDVETVGVFWRLLLKFAHNIEHLKIYSTNYLNRIYFFEPYFNFNFKSEPEDERQKQNEIFLKNLKTLEITCGNLDSLEYFLVNLLSNTPKLQKLTLPMPPGYGFLGNGKPGLPYSVLKGMDKGGLLDRADIKWEGQDCIITFK